MEEGFEIRGADEHALEEKILAGESLAQRIAIMTAILSTLGAVFAYEGGATQNEAMLLKNEALLKKTTAADQWALYQSKSQKQALAELGALVVPASEAEAYKAKAARYEIEKTEISKEAKALDEESARLNEESAKVMKPHHHMAMAMTLLQVGIALASIAALTRRRWLVWCAGVSAAIGVVLGLVGWLA
jgi:hypothetical protein